ncbi:MAG: hydroxymethylglutaryl-CoA synthase [Anaerolineae bacterium]
MMKPIREVGIVGYGAYIPRYRISAAEISRVWKMGEDTLHLEEKAVPGLDEDTATIAIEAARNALRKARIDPQTLGAIWLGSESKPYSVKPTATIVAEAVGATPHTTAADWEFACKAGTEAMQAAVGFVGSGMAQYAMAIGADTAQGRPGDQLEYTAGAGGAAFIMGPREESMAYLEGSHSYVSDTPDFFRRPGQSYPTHGSRFTGEPAYFTHSLMATRYLMEELGYGPQDYDKVIFHQPNSKFPVRLAKRLGFTREQYEDGLLVPVIGNAYAASSALGLAAVLDKADIGERILLTSFGSGAGSDAFSFVTTELITRGRNPLPGVADYVTRRREIDYARYARHRGKLSMY